MTPQQEEGGVNPTRRVRIAFCDGCGEMLGVKNHIRVRSEHLNLTDHRGLRFVEYVPAYGEDCGGDNTCDPPCRGCSK
jgi:hypothetical protein